MMKKKDSNYTILQKPAAGLLKILPARFKQPMLAKIKGKMKNLYVEPEEQLEQRANAFLLKECVLIFWGVLLLVLVIAGLFAAGSAGTGPLIFERNAFGEGEKEVSVVLKDESEEETKNGGETNEEIYSFLLGEQTLTKKEEMKLKETFFRELEEVMAGDNESLSAVTDSLCFEDSLDDWPFTITYEPSDMEYIHLDGSLGEVEEALGEEESFKTQVHVAAEYEAYTWDHSYELCIKKRDSADEKSPFTKAAELLEESEKNTRGEKYYALPESAGSVVIVGVDSSNIFGTFLLGIMLLIFLVMHNVFGLNDQEKVVKKELMRDFPIIVHLMALYMGAGLSLSSAIRRISTEYVSEEGKKKYAFEEILWMDRQMRLGAAQQETCMQWGNA